MSTPIQELIDTLILARDAYYATGDSGMSDAEFDELEGKLREMDPANAYFFKVGSAPPETVKITHREAMLSMAKCKNLTEITEWMNRSEFKDLSFVAEPKLDGISASCYYEDGELKYVATRGDGIKGQDVTENARFIETIPRRVDRSGPFEARGELFLPKNTSYETGGKSLRNNCAGIVARKEGREDARYLKFAAYSIPSYCNTLHTELETIRTLGELGFFTPEAESVTSADDAAVVYDAYLETKRDAWPFETDGLVLIVDDRSRHAELDDGKDLSHHHAYAMALKPPAMSKESSLIGVEWQVSRSGAIIPVALFNPVELGGASIARAGLHNAAFVESLMLRPGDVLVVERANDVIPYIRANLSALGRSESEQIHAFIPTQCPVCATPVTRLGVHVRCPNPQCPERLIQKIVYWVKCCDMEGVAEAAVRALFDAELVRSPSDLYRLTPLDLEGVDGFAAKKTENLLKEIQKSRKMRAREFLSRLGIPQVQEKTLRRLGVRSMADFWDFSNIDMAAGRSLIAWREDGVNAEFVREMEAILTFVSTEEGARESVCLTGKGPAPRAELEARVKAMGYEVDATVTGRTMALITDDPEGSGSKLVKARLLGVKIIKYMDFFIRI